MHGTFASADARNPQAGEIIQGVVEKAYDGDGIVINHVKIRLFGIDAFENTRPRGPEAKKFLSNLVKGTFVRCVVHEFDVAKNRPNAICINAAGKDLSCAVAWQGYAVEWRTKSQGKYKSCDRITPLQETPPPGPAPF